MSEEIKEIQDFFEKIFRSNCSCKHVESSFGSPTAFFSSKRRNFFSQCPEMNKNLDSFFWQPCWRIFDWKPSRVCTVCENVKKIFDFLSKKFSLQDPMDTTRAVFKTLPKNFCQKAKIFGYFLIKIRTHTIFSKKNTFLPSFLVETYISILAVLLEVLWQRTEKVRSINESVEKFTFFSKKHLH